MKSFYPGLAMVMRQAAVWALCLLPVLSVPHAFAAAPGEEITSLLHFIESSQCVFIRNGRRYESAKARQHIAEKYSYYRKRIASAEDFIRYAAAGSIITGEPYRVECNGVEMTSSDWLHAELGKLRQ